MTHCLIFFSKMSFIFHALVRNKRQIVVLIKRLKMTKTRLLMTPQRMMKSKRRRQKNMYIWWHYLFHMILLTSRKLRLAYKEIMCLLHHYVHAWKSSLNVGVMHEGLKNHHVIDGIITTLWIGWSHFKFNVLCASK
jgi:hypothetical protein